MINTKILDFWKQVSLSWCIFYSPEQEKKTRQTMESLADDTANNTGSVTSLIDAILNYEEDDDDGWG